MAATRNWEEFSSFSMVAEHRDDRPTYQTWLNLKIVDFCCYEEFSHLSHVTTIENAIGILGDNFNLSPIADFSVVSKHPDYQTHPLHNIGVIWLSPTKREAADTRYGNVHFVAPNLENLREYKFYVVEFINYVKEKAVRVLVTRKIYPDLASFDLNKNGPIRYKDGKFNFATRYKKSYKEHNVTVEIVMDSLPPFDTFQYASCSNPKPIVNGREVVGIIPGFPDTDPLGYLLFCLLLHENLQSDRSFTSHSRIHTDEITKRISSCQPSQPVNVQHTTACGEGNANECLEQIHFEKVFSFSPSVQVEKYKHVLNLRNLWPHVSPDGYNCIRAILDGVCKMMRESTNERDRKTIPRFNGVMTCFLNHFVTEGQQETVKQKMIEFVTATTLSYENSAQ